MKICIVKLSAMGDIVHSMIALQFLKQKIPNCTIDWIVEKSFQDILQNNPHINTILPIELKSIKKKKSNIFAQIKLLQQYAKNNYDVVIDAQGLFKSAIVSKIVGNRVVGSKIVGFDRYSIREKIATFFYDETVNIGYEQNVIKRSLKVICTPFGIDATKKDILGKKPFLFTTIKTKPKTSYIVFVVGASKQNKIYPKEKFLEIAQQLDDKIIVVWGNDYEFEIANWLAQRSANIQVSTKNTLDELKSLIKNSILTIGADTGPTHIAWGLNKPSITIFGNTPHKRNTYITDINKVVKSKSYVDPLKLDKDDFSIQEIPSSSILNLQLFNFKLL
jgi:heptosyltransferase-1